MPDDAELLRRYARDRSEEAFAALVQRHLPLVYHAALRRVNGDTHLAEDVAQAVFADLARRAGSLGRDTVLAGWLYLATRHAAANTMRTEQRRKLREQESAVMNEPSTGAIAENEWTQLRTELDSVMDELAEGDRDAVLLRYFENRPYAEIGAALRLSEDAARLRVDRTLEKLRVLLARRGITSTAAALGGLLAAQSAVAAPAGLATTVAGSALAGAAVATTAASAGIVAFMTTNKIMIGIAGTLLLLAGGSALHQLSQRQAIEAGMVAVSSERDGLREHLRQQEERTRAAEERERLAAERIAELQKSLVAANERNAGGQNKGGLESKVALANSTPDANRQRLFANAEYVRLQMKITEKNLRLQYGPLYRKLGWSEEKIRDFERLKLQEQQNLFDIMAAAGIAGVSMGNSAVRAQWEDPVVKQTQKDLSSLIGDTDYPAYMEYGDGRMFAVRIPVDSLAGSLYYTESPLTSEQANQLTRLILANMPKATPVDGTITPGQPDWESVYARAAGILTPRQIDTLRAITERNQLFREANALERKLLEQPAAAAK